MVSGLRVGGRLRLLLAIGALMCGLAGAVSATALPAAVPGKYANVAIANTALSYWNGKNGAGSAPGSAACDDARRLYGYTADSDGQCRAFVNCVVVLASGGTQHVGGGSDYFAGFLNAGGVEITDATKLVPGDIVQDGQGSHTFIIVSLQSADARNATAIVVDSNHDPNYPETVSEYSRPFTLSSTERAFRMASVGTPGGGTVRAWGTNSDGVLGNGADPAYVGSSIAVQVIGLSSVTSIAAGVRTTYALRKDRTVWAWGTNIHGELGAGSPATDSSAPVQVKGLSGVTAIASAGNSGYALRSDGTVWAWGDNSQGQLGNGSTSVNSSTPVRVKGLTSITGVAAGYHDGYALRSNGTVFAWGRNTEGQLGNRTTRPTRSPVQVNALTSVRAIAAGGWTGYALRSDGTVRGWGWGQLSKGTTTPWSTTPVQVKGLTGVTRIAAGAQSGYALRNDGTVRAWGRNTQGQLGNGSTTGTTSPVQVKGLTGVKAISGGAHDGYALRADGTVRAWGRNVEGQLGNGTTNDSTTPVLVEGLTGVTSVVGGTDVAYALEK